MSTSLFRYAIHLADNALILGQRNAEWCGHGPVLEQDIAITNISLDLIGQARNFFQLAASMYNGFTVTEKSEVDDLIPHVWKNYGRELEEDDIAFLREERQYRNLLLTELPRGDWAYTVLRQFFFSAWQYGLYEKMYTQGTPEMSAIAEKSVKEAAYHLRWSSEWVIRLGDSTEEAAGRIQNALTELWPFTGELFENESWEAIESASLLEGWNEKVARIFGEATLELPARGSWSQSGGKRGIHTEYLGYLLTELQYLQRAYPNATW